MNSNQNAPETTKYRKDIDGLRALAVLAVLFYHAFPNHLKGGFIGVDIFFVISGFLITRIITSALENNKFTFAHFYSRRIKRIFPALFLVLLGTFSWGWLSMLSPDFRQLGKHILGGAGFASNFILWSEAGYFDITSELKPLLHLWSLGIEEQFYIFCPLLLWWCWRKKWNAKVIFWVLAVLSFGLSLYLVEQNPTAAFYSPLSRMWELLAGCLLSVTSVQLQNKNWQTASSLLGMTLIGLGLYFINSTSGFPGAWALVPVLGTLLLLIAGPDSLLNQTLLSNRPLVGIGLISYPLYLWHWPLLSFARLSYGDLVDAKMKIGLLLLATLLSWLTYQFAEKPIRFGIRNKRLIPVQLGSLMLVMGLLGLSAFVFNGFNFRFPKSVQLLTMNVDFKWEQYIRWDQCHLQNANLVDFDASCFESKRPLVVLWGDSHGSALYPGLRELQKNQNFGLDQMTLSGCAPIFNLDRLTFRRNCNEVNQTIFRKIEQLQPDVLLLHAAWIHEHYPMTLADLHTKFSETLSAIQSKLPNTKIVVIGPVPRWLDSPQKNSYYRWLKSVDKTKAIPKYQPAWRMDDAEDIVSQVAQEKNVKYISLMSVLCKNSDCISRLGDNPEDFIAIDYAHLSRSGSIFVINAIKDKLLE